MRHTMEQIREAMKWWNALSRAEQDELRAKEDMRAADKITTYYLKNIKED